jgi:hypothetical protein
LGQIRRILEIRNNGAFKMDTLWVKFRSYGRANRSDIHMYTGKDPRDNLAKAGPKKPNTVAPAADCLTFGPSTGKGQSWNEEGWYVRAQNFIVHFVLPQQDAEFTTKNHPDEQMYLLPDATTWLRIKTDTEEITVKGEGILIIPPGNTTVTVLTPGRIQRLLTSNSSPNLLELAINRSSYSVANQTVAPCINWPDPIEGFKIRWYSLDVPAEPGRFGRIWRSTNFMINVFPTQNGPRDREKLSPHTHDDFEQCSIGIDGTFLHHLRWPWTINRNEWRADEHLVAPSPSVLIIPPTVEHTTEAIGTSKNLLIDVFCPPRHDFSDMAGWVLNSEEYPQPPHQEHN